MLHLENVCASYGKSQVLFGLNLTVETGSVTTLLGKNGMGKTTTVRTIFGLTDGISGAILFDGKSLVGQKPYQVAKRGIALVPEGRQVFPSLSVIENLVACSRTKSGRSRSTKLREVFDLFPKLEERKHSYGSVLSGGEQQMLAIGRALMTEPRFLILDEATEGLAPAVRRESWRVFQVLKNQGLSILIIDKSLKPLCKLGDAHNIINKGRIVWEGSSAELADPNSRARALLNL